MLQPRLIATHPLRRQAGEPRGRSIGRLWACVSVVVTLLVGAPAHAADYRSAAKRGVVLFDAPASTAKKRFVVNQGYPLEVVIRQGDWIKVRDPAGTLAWVAARDLSDRRTVLVTVAQAALRAEPHDGAKVLAKVGRQVLLDWLAPGMDAPPGWVKVHHAKGKTGWMKLSDVWGGA